MGLVRDSVIPAGANLAGLYPEFVQCSKSTDTPITNAYHKIVSQTGDKNEIAITVGVYTQKNGVVFKIQDYSFLPSLDDSAPNFIKQGYIFLKSLPEFEGAIDA